MQTHPKYGYIPIVTAATHKKLFLHPLLGLHKDSARINKCQWMQFFFVFITNLCFTHKHTYFRLDSILTDCHPAPICNKNKKYYGSSVRRFNYHCNLALMVWVNNKRYYFQGKIIILIKKYGTSTFDHILFNYSFVFLKRSKIYDNNIQSVLSIFEIIKCKMFK